MPTEHKRYSEEKIEQILDDLTDAEKFVLSYLNPSDIFSEEIINSDSSEYFNKIDKNRLIVLDKLKDKNLIFVLWKGGSFTTNRFDSGEKTNMKDRPGLTHLGAEIKKELREYSFEEGIEILKKDVV